MQTSPDITELSKSLATAQGQIRQASKDATNPHLKSQYADLASVWEACRQPLSANGLAVVQCAGQITDGQIEMTTMLTHASGQWISSTLHLPVGKMDAQGCGSAITYARRYSLSAMVGIAPGDDDDGHEASQTPKREKPQTQRRADNEKAQYQVVVTTVKPTRVATKDNKKFAEFVVVGEMPDGSIRESYGFAPMGDDEQWTSDRYSIAAANVGKRVAIFATLSKAGRWQIDTLSEVTNG